MKFQYKTTVFGAISALGVYLTTVTDPAWIHLVGQLLTGAGTFLMGAFARDNNISSEEAGAKGLK